jgi:hypothetical protein
VLAFREALASRPFEEALRQPLPRLLPPLLLLSLLGLGLGLVAFVHSPGLMSVLFVGVNSFRSHWRLARPAVPTAPEESALPHLLALWLLQLRGYLLGLDRPLGHPTAPLSHRGWRLVGGVAASPTPSVPSAPPAPPVPALPGAASPAAEEQPPRLGA